MPREFPEILIIRPLWEIVRRGGREMSFRVAAVAGLYDNLCAAAWRFARERLPSDLLYSE